MNKYAMMLITAVLIGFIGPAQATDVDSQTQPLSVIVMDPLAAPLSCPCVEGYAQRRYEVLAAHLEKSLGKKVTVTFNESLAVALKKTGGRADLIIGKDSVVKSDAALAGKEMRALSRLTDLEGKTTQYGMVVVGKDDPAKSVSDLDGYTVIFGPREADEKHSAALKLLQDAGVSIPAKLHIDEACSDGACKVIELGPKSKTAAVISSYAQPLLEGCGTIKKGDLRMLGKTQPVPFITLFASTQLSEAEQEHINKAVASVTTEPAVLEALESLVGFLPVTDSKTESSSVAKKK